MMILATYYDTQTDCDHGEKDRIAEVFTDWEMYHSKTFSPDSEPKILMNFELGNGSYRELQNKLHNMSVTMSNLWGELYGLSYYEYSLIQDWFEDKGRKYGLLREFRENAIC